MSKLCQYVKVFGLTRIWREVGGGRAPVFAPVVLLEERAEADEHDDREARESRAHVRAQRRAQALQCGAHLHQTEMR
jgi:hypothetical protein